MFANNGYETWKENRFMVRKHDLQMDSCNCGSLVLKVCFI